MNDISALLREKNLKKTPLRMAILSLFFEKKSPLSVQNLTKMLQKEGVSPNKTSLYRQVETLCEADILSPVSLATGAVHYEVQLHHHHHFQCKNCHSIECIHDDEIEHTIYKLEGALQKKGFSHLSHHFSLSGVCKACQ